MDRERDIIVVTDAVLRSLITTESLVTDRVEVLDVVAHTVAS
jgi:hypothetical protein